MKAPFPAFGGKRDIAADVWRRFGEPRQYIEPFCFSAAVLLAAPQPASLEVINDLNGFVANFWRATKCQPAAVAQWADYPVSHIDLGARHRWLMEQRDRIGCAMQDPNWPGDAQVAGWWMWGQCCWIGSGWCDWTGKVPHVGNAGRGVQALGQVPHVGNAGMGIQSIAANGDDVPGLWTSSGRVAWRWLHELATRLERVRVCHGEWTRCLNNHYGAEQTAVFLDPPYRGYGEVYGTGGKLVADEAADWAREHADIRVALCGHIGDYDLPGWTEWPWSRKRLTYSGSSTTDKECVWFSPACLPEARQLGLFNGQ